MTDQDYRKALVSMLNMLGNRSKRCSENTTGCEGCMVDAELAMDEGLAALGYPDWRRFHAAEILGVEPL